MHQLVYKIAHEWTMAMVDALDRPDLENATLPGHEWIDARLRELGCPKGELAKWRTEVLRTPSGPPEPWDDA
jgi:hypothetical protein